MCVHVFLFVFFFVHSPVSFSSFVRFLAVVGAIVVALDLFPVFFVGEHRERVVCLFNIIYWENKEKEV